MAEIWKPQPIEVLKNWVETILTEASDELNAWELKFITDVDIRLMNGWSLTQSQEEKLEQIYANKTK